VTQDTVVELPWFALWQVWIVTEMAGKLGRLEGNSVNVTTEEVSAVMLPNYHLSCLFTLATTSGSHEMAAPKSPALSGQQLSGQKRQHPELPEDADEQQTKRWMKAVLNVSAVALVGSWVAGRLGIDFICCQS
jgi:hypothetical protein